MSQKILVEGGESMIRFLANRYTKEELRALREAIETAYNELAAYGYKCRYHRPCHDLHNLMKHLDELLSITEGVQK